MSNILLIEDEAAIAETLVFALRQASFEVEHCRLGREGLAALARSQPALVILDVGLPDIDGFQVLRQLRAQDDIPVLMLTARSEEIDRVLGLELGILKRTQPVPALAGSNVLRLDEAGARIFCAGQALLLTRYEYLLLKTLMQAPARVFSRSQLMDLVWTHEVSQERTVDTHIKSLRAKLAALAPGPELIQTHRGLGYSYQP